MSKKTFSRLNASIRATLKPHGGRGGSGRLGGTHHSHSAHCLFNIFTGRSLGNRPKSLSPCGGAVEVGYFERCLVWERMLPKLPPARTPEDGGDMDYWSAVPRVSGGGGHRPPQPYYRVAEAGLLWCRSWRSGTR